ncbi:MAG: Tex family protein [Syntrophomonadaceae bacterium]
MYPRIVQETGISLQQVKACIQLLDGGNTVPFVARYRKEATGGLDENQIRLIEERLQFHRNLEQRKEEVLRLIDEQGQLTEQLTVMIRQAEKLVQVEDLYLPYRPKRKTRASQAREKGLQGLADYFLSFPQTGNVEEEALLYTSEDLSSHEALQGAMDIVAEMAAEDAIGRGWIRDYTRRTGILQVAARDRELESPYRMYYEYQEAVAKIPPHRILAINRGEREDILKVALTVEPDRIIEYLEGSWVKTGITADYVSEAVKDGYLRLSKPAVERDLRAELSQRAQEQAIKVFAQNLGGLLLQPPVKGQIVLGLDPAYRTGCKWTVVDDTGKMLEVGVVYPTPPHKKIAEAKKILTEKIRKYGVTVIAIGNGTASRETEQFIADLIREMALTVPYTIVSEAGASVYSASKLAAQEFPELDVSERSAVSIARRLQDPLAELVKIEPKAIGVGQYQHDLPRKELDSSLNAVVESAVNRVGVELNTASPSLLSYVSGLSAAVAGNIVKHRDENGRFKNRRQLLKVPKLGPKAYEQAAGFLRVYGGENPLDSTAIHPESYGLAEKLLNSVGADPGDIGKPVLTEKLRGLSIKKLSQELEAGEPTLKDVLDCLQKPHRDPREDLPAPIFRTDVLSIDDLLPGMVLNGTVRNVVDFGAFVDIGIKNDGLVHISEMAERFIRHPSEVVSVGDVVSVRVLSVDKGRGKVALSLKPET